MANEGMTVNGFIKKWIDKNDYRLFSYRQAKIDLSTLFEQTARDAMPDEKFIATFTHPFNGYEHDQKQAIENLTVGRSYNVTNKIIHNFSTEIFLEGFPDLSFNSVLFDIDGDNEWNACRQQTLTAIAHAAEKMRGGE